MSNTAPFVPGTVVVLIRPHLGYAAAQQEANNTDVLFAKRTQKNNGYFSVLLSSHLLTIK